jgi:hypothetical protein
VGFGDWWFAVSVVVFEGWALGAGCWGVGVEV